MENKKLFKVPVICQVCKVDLGRFIMADREGISHGLCETHGKEILEQIKLKKLNKGNDNGK